MSLKKLPKIEVNALSGVEFDVPQDAIEKWSPSTVCAYDDSATITVYDEIGSYYDGVTARRISAALRAIGERDVTVVINSPGGDFFEGVAIYNILREHNHKVYVKIVGLAASAASVIAMAGDEIQIAKTGFLMIHNAWSIVVGNRNDLREAADVLEQFDSAMVSAYSDATGIKESVISSMMDSETFINGEKAVELGFASSLLPADGVKEDNSGDVKSKIAIRKVDAILAKSGISRNGRRELFAEIKGTHDAAFTVTHDADLEDINNLIKSIRGN